IRNSFHKFAKLLPSKSDGGALIINGDIPNLEEITASLPCQIITYGSSSYCDYIPTDITFDEFGHPSFILTKSDGTNEGSYSLCVPGLYNVYNACAAIAAAKLLGIDDNVISKALSDFNGTDRRFEYKGKVNGFSIIDDYAHHPTEITQTLKAAKNYPHKTIWCVFQPHTYTRTKAFLSEFAKALTLSDKIILADIYAAREKDTLGISSRTLQEEIEKLGHECYYFSSFEEIENFILKNCTKDDLLITMGAGDVVKIGENLLRK
ncbi:MAG: UDP-N-acetylmuramate--L-alanine ligase, partial [Lachnospiraceae bacterium]|nr:UDP-N-acetylmuramate--L-alanine ligase [Lachnospiraceae bacterium]